MYSRRFAVVVVLIALGLLPLTILGARRAVESNANDVRDWLPAHYVETSQYRWYQEAFGSEDFVVVSWPGCTLFDTRLDRLVERLNAADAERGEQGQSPLFRRVTTGRELVEQMTSEPMLLEREEVIDRLQGTIVGPDGHQTCAVITLTDEARAGLRPTLAEIERATRGIGLVNETVHFGGPPVVNAAIDASSTQSLVRLAGLAGLIGLVVAWLCFRTVRLTLIVFIISGYASAMSLAVVPLCGVPLNAILVTMVPLVYVAGMSGAIHLSNYYLDSLAAGYRSQAIGRAVAHAALPLGLATATTAIGLLSLYYSDLAPIRLFGIFSAIGIAIGLAMQLVLLPAILTLWPAPSDAKLHRASDDDEVQPLSPVAGWLAGLVIRRQAWFGTACIVAMLVGIYGATRVETSIQIMRLFAPDTPIIGSYAWLEENLGALVPMEVVLRFDQTNEQSMLDRMALVRDLQAEIATVPNVGGSLSAATFAPDIRLEGGSLRSFMVNRRLRQARPRLEQSGYLVAKEDGEELWRVSVRVSAVDDLDYGEFKKELRAKVEPLLDSYASEANGVEAVYTGAVPIIYKARRSLLDGLLLGFTTDVALIVISVVILLRHWTNGLLLLLVSIFPMALVFGFMGWMGIVIDIGTVMTPCVALGVTIDDVVHFVLWFRRGIQRGMSVPEAVKLAYTGCGRAMVQSWGVIGMGLAVFALSTFIPTFRFGALMIALLTAGLIGNVVFLPALLAGPLGHVIAGHIRRRQAAEQPADAEAGTEELEAEPLVPGRRATVVFEREEAAEVPAAQA